MWNCWFFSILEWIFFNSWCTLRLNEAHLMNWVHSFADSERLGIGVVLGSCLIFKLEKPYGLVMLMREWFGTRIIVVWIRKIGREEKEKVTHEQVEICTSTHLYIHPPGGDVLLIHMTRPLRTENSLLNDVLKSRKPFITNQSSLKIIIIFIDYWKLQKE